MTKTKVPEILWPAQRQYRHNSGDDALVFGFDQYETVKVVTSLQKRITELEKYINELKDKLGWARIIDISEGGGDESQ